jgi:hypothetical protein
MLIIGAEGTSTNSSFGRAETAMKMKLINFNLINQNSFLL